MLLARVWRSEEDTGVVLSTVWVPVIELRLLAGRPMPLPATAKPSFVPQMRCLSGVALGCNVSWSLGFN